MNKGAVFTEEHGKKLSESHRGIRYVDRKKLSLEDKKKLSEAHVGNQNCLGKRWKIDPEKLKLRALKKGNHTACSHSEETNKKISASRKGKAPWNKGRKVSEEERQKLVEMGISGRIKQAANGKIGSTIENIVEKHLEKSGVSFVAQKPFQRFMLDFYVPVVNLVIECDGDYWHNRSEVKERDLRKDQELSKEGYHLLRLSEKDIKNGNFMLLLANKITKLSLDISKA